MELGLFAGKSRTKELKPNLSESTLAESECDRTEQGPRRAHHLLFGDFKVQQCAQSKRVADNDHAKKLGPHASDHAVPGQQLLGKYSSLYFLFIFPF